MNQELEALVMAFDATLEDSPHTAQRREIYKGRLEDVLARYPGMSLESLERSVRFQHARWLRAQSKPPTLPPTA